MAMADGYVLEHRFVAYEAGVLTERADHVHHRNGDKRDNRIENLQVISAGDHQRIHHLHEIESYDRWRLRVREELGERSCEVCGADITPLRIDATVCGNKCRIARWKRRQTVPPRALSSAHVK